MNRPKTDPTWRRLSIRVVWVDLARSILSLVPGIVAVVFVGTEFSPGVFWPLLTVAAWGLVGAFFDIVRWAFTRYRVTETEIERRTGVLTRRHRTVQRDRIRSVDLHAKLRHRIAGLRIVTIGAGQQSGAGESAFYLDALSVHDATVLRKELLDSTSHITADEAPPTVEVQPAASEPAHNEKLLATLRPWWVVYNMFSIWAYLTAAGLLWGLHWLLLMFNVNLYAFVSQLADWHSIGWFGTTVVALVVIGAIGAIGMGINFITSYWNFELAQVRTGDKTYLRTRRGLFSTREVNRDEARMRGMSIAEPLLWRWMGLADTNIITTGLSLWSMEQPTAILPRGPVKVAREVSAQVLGDPSPLTARLRRHPMAALRRRLWWATWIGLAPAVALIVPAATNTVPIWALWVALVALPVALLGAVISYRVLGHAVVGDYLVVRSGLMSRSTSALLRSSVSTIAVRQSILQRRLGLSTVSAMSAAGWGAYEAIDISSDEAVSLASQFAPRLVDEFTLASTKR
ncbi:putative membrane protein [Micrococcales bacterium KH10]|nr:putative membrane protein [Micrococcales bacterium KH10]